MDDEMDTDDGHEERAAEAAYAAETESLNEADNQTRLIAAEIIRQLYESGNDVQLELLRLQIEASMQAIAAGEDDQTHPEPERGQRSKNGARRTGQ